MEATRRRLLWALGISAALHLSFLLGPHISLPQPEPAKELTVRLEPLPHPVPPPPKPKPRAHRPSPPPPATPRSATTAKAEEPVPPSPVEAEPAPTPETTPSQAKELPAPAPPPRPLSPLPAQVKIVYTLYKGDQKLNVGRMTNTLRVVDNRYTLTSIAEATGLFSLFVSGKLIQVSRGDITAEGLRPAEFWIERGQSQDRTESASFDWAVGLLRYGRPNERNTIPLQKGTQDVLSVVYQLAMTAPHNGKLELAVTNGRKFDHYTYRVVGEEKLETPLGALRTEHLTKVTDPNEDTLDLWLAADYHYLPVRLRIVDKNGDAAEQIVQSMSSN
jgi:hypothetical protein